MTVDDQSQAYTTEDTLIGILYTLKVTRLPNERTALKAVGSHPNVVLNTCEGDLHSNIIQNHEDSSAAMKRESIIET